MPNQPANSIESPAVTTGARARLRVLMVDDHFVVRQGLKQVLVDKYPDAEFGEAGDAREVFVRLAEKTWDVMLLDINLPGQSGLDVLNQVHDLHPNVKVLILTMHPEDQYATRALKGGADGYITKDSAAEQLAIAVAKVLGGGKYISPAFAESLAGNLSGAGEKSPHEMLSDREYQIMRMMASGKAVKEISGDLSLSVKTVSTYRTRLLRKLRLKSNAELIRYALRERLVE